MALFSKPPSKRPLAKTAKAVPDKQADGRAARPRHVSARELAAKAGSMAGARPRLEPIAAEEPTTGASLIEWSPQPQAFEVAQANPCLCAVLENAAVG